MLSSAHSHALRKLGWKGSLKSIPACYLLGLWAGKEAKKKGVEKAYLYNGPAPFVKGTRIPAFVKGVADAGVDIPFSDEVIPSGGGAQGREHRKVRQRPGATGQAGLREALLGAAQSRVQARVLR